MAVYYSERPNPAPGTLCIVRCTSLPSGHVLVFHHLAYFSLTSTAGQRISVSTLTTQATPFPALTYIWMMSLLLAVAFPIPLRLPKSFSPNPIAVNGTSTLSFTLANSNSIAFDRGNIYRLASFGSAGCCHTICHHNLWRDAHLGTGCGRNESHLWIANRRTITREQFLYGQCQYNGHSFRVVSKRKRVYFIHKWRHQHQGLPGVPRQGSLC